MACPGLASRMSMKATVMTITGLVSWRNMPPRFFDHFVSVKQALAVCKAEQYNIAAEVKFGEPYQCQ